MNVSSLPLMFRSIRRTTNLRRWRNDAPVRDVHVPLIPAKAGIQRFAQELDARLRGHKRRNWRGISQAGGARECR
jgi:hypothetical protein